MSIVGPKGWVDPRLEHFFKGPRFHVEVFGLIVPRPVETRGIGGRGFDDEKGAHLENPDWFGKFPVGVHESPNPSDGPTIALR